MRNTLIFILLSVFHSCTYDSGTKDTLKLSGKNKKELLKVIEHYKNEPNKKAATNFLLNNMGNKFAYTGELLEHYDLLLHVFDSLYKHKVYTGDPNVLKRNLGPLNHSIWPLIDQPARYHL